MFTGPKGGKGIGVWFDAAGYKSSDAVILGCVRIWSLASDGPGDVDMVANELMPVETQST